MSRAAELLASQQKASTPSILGYGQFEVIDLAEDARDVVVTTDGGETTQVMRCTSGYTTRAEGDVVLAHQYRGGWLVVGKIGAPPIPEPPPPPTPLTKAEVQAMINASLPPEVNVAWSAGAPSGTGWDQAVATYLRDDGAGARSLHFDIVAAVAPSPKPPPPPAPPAAAPGPATRSPDSEGGWRGSQAYDEPMAGDASPYSDGGDRIGGWFYGTDIAAACAGKTVAKMVVTITRQDSNHGRNAKVPVRLATHTKTSKGKPTLSNKWSTGTSLARGGSASITLPANVRDALASGSAKGLACWGNGTSDYIRYVRSGKLVISFS